MVEVIRGDREGENEEVKRRKGGRARTAAGACPCVCVQSSVLLSSVVSRATACPRRTTGERDEWDGWDGGSELRGARGWYVDGRSRPVRGSSTPAQRAKEQI